MVSTNEIGAATRQRPTPRHQEQESMMQSQRIALHPTAVKVLRALQATEAKATNHMPWIADEAGVSDSTARRWLKRLEDLNMVGLAEDEGDGPGRKDWIWNDPHVYWEVYPVGEAWLEGEDSDG